MSKHYVEVGGGQILTLWDKLEDGDTLDVFEPNIKNIKILQKDYGSRITIFPYAIWKESGKIMLSDSGPTSFVRGVNSPEICNNNTENHSFYEVDACTFDEFDKGNIDHICLDVEGSEWYVLDRMISRPQVIEIEMEYAAYRNPFYDDIESWMKENDYVLRNKDGANFVYHKA